MRLARWSLHSFSLAYARPVRWSDVVESEARFVLLELESEEGHIGCAEVTVKPTWNGATERTVAASLRDLFVPILEKTDLADVPRAMSRMPENQAVKALIDNALWDLRSASDGRPPEGAEVEVSWAVTRQAPRAMAEEAAAMCAQHGFRGLKVKGGQGMSGDVQAMREIRAAVGEEVRLFVDANGAYSWNEAASYIKAMADAGAEIVEDPCRLLPHAGLRALQKASPLPILVDFDCTSKSDAALFIEQGARALSLKPARLGLSETSAMAAMAAEAGCIPVVGLFGESVLGTASSLRLASRLPAAALPAEVTWFLAMSEQLTNEPLHIRDGRMRLPPRPSLANTLDRSRLRPL